MASSKAAYVVSPLIKELKAAYARQYPNGALDAVRIQWEKDWMFKKLNDLGWHTLKPTREHPEGEHITCFVTFDELDIDSEAYKQVQDLKLPTANDFSKILAVMSHLNQKTTDTDKICIPRRQRLNAIVNELMNGSTSAPAGYASERTAGWKHEVKKDWRLIPKADGTSYLHKNGTNNFGCAIPLEKAYKIIAESHISGPNNRHIGRDKTWLEVQRVTGSNFFQMQIVKDFVALCPTCKDSKKRESRMQGVATTRSIEGANSKKDLSKLKKRSHFESKSDQSTSSPKKRSIKTTLKPNSADPQAQMDKEHDLLDDPTFGSLYQEQPKKNQDQSVAYAGAQFDQGNIAYPAQLFGHFDGPTLNEQQPQDFNYYQGYPAYTGPVESLGRFDLGTFLTRTLDTEVHNAATFAWPDLDATQYSIDELVSTGNNNNQVIESIRRELQQKRVMSQPETIDPAILVNKLEPFQQVPDDDTSGHREWLGLNDSQGMIQPRVPDLSLLQNLNQKTKNAPQYMIPPEFPESEQLAIFNQQTNNKIAQKDSPVEKEPQQQIAQLEVSEFDKLPLTNPWELHFAGMDINLGDEDDGINFLFGCAFYQPIEA